MRRLAKILALAALAMTLAAPAASADEWRSQQPVAGIGVPTTIGEIGDVEFWAPNRGMLITAGNEGVAPGLFAYDGTGWYRYSTVCGGHEGRIAYAGPHDFWTISDQQAGQETGSGPARAVSLCHFVNGAVVASYAEPVGTANSYLRMSGAACASPSDCWFGGERLPGTTNVGAFHLHWDGATVTPIPSLTEPHPELEDPGRAVTGMVVHQGAVYESVAVRAGDQAPAEPAAEPSLLHQIFTLGGAPAFVPLFTDPAIAVEPDTLEGLHLSSDEDEMWGVAGATSGSTAAVVAVRLGESGFERVSLQDPGEVLAAGDGVGDAAVEPGAEAAWVSFRQPSDFEGSPARLTRIHANGAVDAEVRLPSEAEGIGPKGPVTALACPAQNQCWAGTERGWLFHLGSDLPRNTDPLLHVLVTYRPPDPSLPSVPPTSVPEDNSGANQEKGKPAAEEPEPLPKSRPALYSKLKTKLLDGDVLRLTFVLREKARVQLLAKRNSKVVAKTPRKTLDKGKQELRLRLDPKQWPTKLDLEVERIGKGTPS